ncbi:hypothetical protein ACRB8A_14930 [Arthrobacter sp. G.S.26]|uniref:hypothetical protein n=1 Tax=Arthrobacter sp. G.S.26 TaxID=3433706 RepID=UPI003D770DDD
MLSHIRAGGLTLSCAALLVAGTVFSSTAASAAQPAPAPATGGSAAQQAATRAAGNLGSVSSFPGQAAQLLTIPVLAGLQPTRVTGTIEAPSQTAGTIRVTARGRVLLEAPAAAALALDAPLTPADVSGNEVVLGLEYLPAVRDVCTAAGSGATLSNVALATAGTETLPTTVAGFLAPSVPAVFIPVPADPASDVSAAILSASAAMTHRYPNAAVTVLPAADLAAAAADAPSGSRIITISAGTGAAGTTLTTEAGRPALAISGSGEELRTAAQALASPQAALADSGTVTGMTAAAPAAAGPEQTLADLGATGIRLAGYGTQEAYLGISQSQFGGPVSAWTAQIRGTHTAIPTGGQASLSVYWNDYLLSSQTLDGDTFDITAAVPAGQIQARNGLRLRLTALPAGGDCSGPAGLLPMELTVDTTGSKLTGERGHSVKPGFARFPQVLGGSLPVAFDDGASPQENTVNAAALTAALQRDSATLLDISLTDPTALLDSSNSGLLVGATAATAEKAAAPLRLAEFRSVAARDIEFGVGTSAPYGVLEAFEHNGRNLLLLGGWAPGAAQSGTPTGTLQAGLASFVQQQDGGWSALSRNLLVTQTTGAPVLLETNAVTPQAEVTDGYRPLALWIAAAAGILALTFLGRILLRRRHRRQAAAFADAKAAQAVEAAEPTHGS